MLIGHAQSWSLEQLIIYMPLSLEIERYGLRDWLKPPPLSQFTCTNDVKH